MQTDDLPKVAALRYKQKVWWVDVEDFTQEAWVTVLRAKQTFDPAVGVPLDAYLWRAAMLHLREYCWRQSSPVYASADKLTELVGVHSVALDTKLTDHTTVETLTDTRKLATLIKLEVRKTIMRQRGGEVATDILLEGFTMKEACERHGVTNGAALSSLKRARRGLVENILLNKMWRRYTHGG